MRKLNAKLPYLAAKIVTGGSGDDYLQSGDGRDVLLGGDGDNYLEAGTACKVG